MDNLEKAGLIEYKFTAKSRPPEEDCGWHFAVFPKELSKEIRGNHKHQEEGWGRMKATAKIGNSEWKTSIWFDTKHDTYWLPLKAEIRRKEKIVDDKDVEVSIWL